MILLSSPSSFHPFHVCATLTRLALTLILLGQDGTINYLNLPAITDGLRFLSAYLPFLPLRLSTLTHYLVHSLAEFRHDATGTPVARVLSRIPSKPAKAVGEQAETGSVISLVFLSVLEPVRLSSSTDSHGPYTAKR